jgi:hypothetical protein
LLTAVGVRGGSSITPSAGTPRFVDDDVGFLYEREVVGR